MECEVWHKESPQRGRASAQRCPRMGGAYASLPLGRDVTADQMPVVPGAHSRRRSHSAAGQEQSVRRRPIRKERGKTKWRERARGEREWAAKKNRLWALRRMGAVGAVSLQLCRAAAAHLLLLLSALAQSEELFRPFQGHCASKGLWPSLAIRSRSDHPYYIVLLRTRKQCARRVRPCVVSRQGLRQSKRSPEFR